MERDLGGPFDPNPKYNYAYQISDDDEQTYIAHQENRDGSDVTGEYSYVDPLGSLITVKYTAGPDGYLETRNVQEGFVVIRQKSNSAPALAVTQTQVRPIAVPQQTTTLTSSTATTGDSDLVAKIISQLTPFIQDTVSNSLSSTSSQQGISRPTVSAAPIATSVPLAPAAAPVQQASASSVQGVFGVSGQNTVRVETPNFNFNYDLQK